MGKIQSATVPMLFNVGAVAAQSSGEAELPIVLSAVAATAASQLAFLRNAADENSAITVTVVASGGVGNFGASASATTSAINVLDTDGAGVNSTVTLVCEDFLKVAFAAGINTISITDLPGGIEAVASAKVSNVASAMVVKVKSDCHTDTTPNAKHDILQQGFVGDRTHFQVSEPIIGLSTWNTNLAMGGGNDFQLHLTISPDYLRDLMYDVSGQMGCPVHDGAAGRFGSTDPTIKKNQVYLRVKSVQLHVAYVHPAAAHECLRAVCV